MDVFTSFDPIAFYTPKRWEKNYASKREMNAQETTREREVYGVLVKTGLKQDKWFEMKREKKLSAHHHLSAFVPFYRVVDTKQQKSLMIFSSTIQKNA